MNRKYQSFGRPRAVSCRRSSEAILGAECNKDLKEQYNYKNLHIFMLNINLSMRLEFGALLTVDKPRGIVISVTVGNTLMLFRQQFKQNTFIALIDCFPRHDISV